MIATAALDDQAPIDGLSVFGFGDMPVDRVEEKLYRFC